MPKGQYDRSHLIGKMRRGTSPPPPSQNPVFRDDISRGEIRFAAEVLLETIGGGELPENIMHRALSIAGQLARG